MAIKRFYYQEAKLRLMIFFTLSCCTKKYKIEDGNLFRQIPETDF